MIIPNIWENKKCSKPPTSDDYLRDAQNVGNPSETCKYFDQSLKILILALSFENYPNDFWWISPHEPYDTSVKGPWLISRYLTFHCCTAGYCRENI